MKKTVFLLLLGLLTANGALVADVARADNELPSCAEQYEALGLEPPIAGPWYDCRQRLRLVRYRALDEGTRNSPDLRMWTFHGFSFDDCLDVVEMIEEAGASNSDGFFHIAFRVDRTPTGSSCSLFALPSP